MLYFKVDIYTILFYFYKILNFPKLLSRCNFKSVKNGNKIRTIVRMLSFVVHIVVLVLTRRIGRLNRQRTREQQLEQMSNSEFWQHTLGSQRQRRANDMQEQQYGMQLGQHMWLGQHM